MKKKNYQLNQDIKEKKYTVEKIVGHNFDFQNIQIYYTIKWQYYDDISNTQEPLEHLKDAMLLVNNYNRENQLEEEDNLENDELVSLQNEVEILTQIDHPNIVKLYEIFEDDCNFYMVLELMKGGELFERIVEQEHFSEHKAAETIKPIIDALQYCHEMEIAHRDLKPENLLYATKDPGSIVKISDFGLARFINNEVMTTMCGTPGYVAPEIINGSGYDKSIDYWSLGVILYIMLCGFPPFHNENAEELFDIIKQGKYEFPSPAWDDISKEAKDLIKGLLNVDSHKRLTYEQIIKHPWLAQKGINYQPIPELRGKLKDFNAKKQFKKIGVVLKVVNSMMQTTSSYKK
ncbi:Protein kinase-like domain [Pseudocohnilembus persalinus]|uniref:Protein kinase-like domain n=1 Tax=Pseudocohnilembus persalinus TaxID=266149 RepID=A0A0V0QIE7_PSEPJ|nr:Protein kinase-like domain [Pseudocohnilembus persalinus]|eukprot:KRX01998.1 Protein kinase-like domain [Pseudocohnilembus persalinus]